MKAVIFNEYGGNQVLQIADVPKPKLETPFDIIVHVQAVATNPIDWKVREGALKTSEKPEKRIILGWDASGIVEEVGTNVANFKIGDKVMFAGTVNRDGSFAEYALVDSRIVGHAPESISIEEAAALPLTSLTAYESIVQKLGHSIPETEEKFKANHSKVILIIGGAGGVAGLAIQLARKVIGLTTVATASRQESREFCKKLGADHIIDHTKELKPQLAALGIEAVDSILLITDSTQSLIDQAAAITKPWGKVCGLVRPDSPLVFASFWVKSIDYHQVLMFTRPLFQTPDLDNQHEQLEHIREFVNKKVIIPHVGKAFDSFKDIKEALEIQQSGRAIGKLVVRAKFD